MAREKEKRSGKEAGRKFVFMKGDLQIAPTRGFKTIDFQ